jgi:hypothetical protein
MAIHQEAPPDVRPRLSTAGTVARSTLIGVALAAVAGMYGLLFVLPLVGWGMLSAARYPVVLFGSVHLLFLAFLAHFGAILFHTLINPG